MKQKNMIEFRNISKRFSEDFVLEDFSYKIEKGDKVRIVGRSGIGKTTLFRLLLGFVQPDAGEIYVDKHLLDEKSVWSWRHRVAYVSQDLNIGAGPVGDFFASTLALKANQDVKATATNRINELIRYFQLPADVLESRIESLSGGERQRVAIINILLLDRNIYLLDEVGSALDAALRDKTLKYFLDRPDDTVLFISHDEHQLKQDQIKNLNL